MNILSQHRSLELHRAAEFIRLHSMEAIGSCGAGHVGGVLSIAELTALLYQEVLRYDPKYPEDPARDRVVLSKGHCGPALYAALALAGFFPMEELLTLNQNGSSLPSHCNMHKTPGIDIGTGSLGQGASLAAGMALGLKKRSSASRVFLILGDGECNEGQVWEAVLFAAHQQLDNLIAYVDVNKQQLDGYTEDICSLGDLRSKFESFGWRAIQADGHNIDELHNATQEILRETGRPGIVIMDTVKGKGWSGVDGKPGVHHVPISSEQLEEARKEITHRIESLTAQLEGIHD